jgi:uncharacterized RDD family membrane protein YckC
MSSLRHETLLGLDNVQLELPVAPFPLRILAAVVDYFLFTILVIAMMVLGIFGAGFLGFRSPWILAAMLILYFLLEYGYFAGLEILMNGQTPGKRALGLRVTTRHGGQASPGAILIRNAFRSLDMAVGVIFMIIDPLGRRIGDRVGGTLVLETRAAEVETIVRRVPPGWGTKEIGVVEELLRRSAAMDPQDSRRLARKLLETIERDNPGFLGPEIEMDPVRRLRDELGIGND